jgi:hypothetical protein
MSARKEQAEVSLSKHEERKRSLKKFTYRGVELQNLLDLKEQDLFRLFSSRLRRKFRTGIWKRQQTFLKKLRKAVCPILKSISSGHGFFLLLMVFLLVETELPNW